MRKQIISLCHQVDNLSAEKTAKSLEIIKKQLAAMRDKLSDEQEKHSITTDKLWTLNEILESHRHWIPKPLQNLIDEVLDGRE